jgi:hypothetical protein
MVVSIVMAIFFQEQPEPGELAGPCSIEGLLPAWCQQPSARSPKGATRTGHGWIEDLNEETMSLTAGKASPPAMERWELVKPPFVQPRDP